MKLENSDEKEKLLNEILTLDNNRKIGKNKDILVRKQESSKKSLSTLGEDKSPFYNNRVMSAQTNPHQRNLQINK